MPPSWETLRPPSISAAITGHYEMPPRASSWSCHTARDTSHSHIANCHTPLLGCLELTSTFGNK
eukprot:1439743-Lingulodinium_polyedra.AAC.1